MNNEIIDPQLHQNVSNIGRLLLEKGKISPQDTERILRKQNEDGIRFGDAAKQLGLITEEDVQQVLSQQFDYAYLPSNSSYSHDLVCAYHPSSSKVEGFRALRSQLMFRWFNEGFKAISVVSATSGEGSSYTAANLAVVFSQLGKKTLLIDGNMRNPSQQKIFNLKQSFGLSDILAERTTGTEALSNIADLPNLTVLGSGTVPPNPQELIGRATFTKLIKYASSIFDVIIVDTPALSHGADAQMLTSFVGGALMVTRKNHTSLSDSINLKSQIQSSGAILVGAVLNEF